MGGKEMKNKYLIGASLVMAALLSAACVEEKNYNEIRVPGEPIRFSAQTGYVNGDGTRTEYSGALYDDSNGYERIDWVNNDPMKIIYVQGTEENAANYKVTGVTADNVDSYAQVTVDGTELLWGSGSGANKFYAMYPTQAKNASASLQKVGNNYRATGTILPTQDVDASKMQTIQVQGDSWDRYRPDMDYNYLLAYADDNTGISGNSVRLPFRPAVTAFELRFQRVFGDTDRKVTKFELFSSSDALTGQFQIDITGGNAKGATWGTPAVPSRTAANSVITVNFPTGGVSLPTEGYLDFTVFALPSDLHDLTMTLTYADGKHATLPLNNKDTGAPYVFTGARKYIITNSNVPGTQEWHYVIEEIEDQTFVGHGPVYPIAYNVKSYKWSERTGQSVKYPVAWKTQYSLDGGTTWADVPATGTITGSDYSVESGAVTGPGVGTNSGDLPYSAGEARNARLNNSTDPTTAGGDHSAQDIIDELKGRPSKSDYDLSMHDVFGNDHLQTTANSYVVTAPGTYKFPVVYGNAITNGRDYVEAYYPAINGEDPGAPGVVSSLYSSVYYPHKDEGTFRYLGRFRSATNLPISKPNIVEDFEFWESENVRLTPGYVPGGFTPSDLEAVIVWQHSMELTTDEPAHAIVSNVSYNNKYITFTVSPDDIRPGNAVIALRGKVGTRLPAGSILWSWQIWVTANDLTPVTVTEEGGKLMPFNLGYIDSTPAGSIMYPNRDIKFRIVQVEGGVEHEQEDFLLVQRGDGHAWDANVGFNVYYQWGRKDPMIPAKDYGYRDTYIPQIEATDRNNPDFHGTPGHRDVYPNASIVAGDYTINVEGIDIAGGFFGPDDSNYAAGIQSPYNAYLNTLTTGWVGGYVNGYHENPSLMNAMYNDEKYRGWSAIPVNLWNNAAYTTMDGNEGLGMYKTVYDPCPPGFCVPTAGVFQNFTADTVVGRSVEGVYFNTPGGRVFMPYSGIRVFYNQGNGHSLLYAEDIRKSGFYWTDTTFGNVGATFTDNGYYYSKCFSFGVDKVNKVIPLSGSMSYTKGSSMAIRPMVDPKY